MKNTEKDMFFTEKDIAKTSFCYIIITRKMKG